MASGYVFEKWIYDTWNPGFCWPIPVKCLRIALSEIELVDPSLSVFFEMLFTWYCYGSLSTPDLHVFWAVDSFDPQLFERFLLLEHHILNICFAIHFSKISVSNMCFFIASENNGFTTQKFKLFTKERKW